MQEHKQIKIPLIIGGLVLIITLGFGIGVALAVSKNTSTPTATTNTSTNTTTGSTTNTTKSFKNGTYSATGSYRTPGGTEKISVTVQIENDLIKAVSVVDQATDRESQQYNSMFAKGISGVVVGKSINTTFAPRVVNGASITINGFDKALTTIRTQAKI